MPPNAAQARQCLAWPELGTLEMTVYAHHCLPLIVNGSPLDGQWDAIFVVRTSTGLRSVKIYHVGLTESLDPVVRKVAAWVNEYLAREIRNVSWMRS